MREIAGVITSFAMAGLASAGLSAAWYPLRSSQSNVEAALGLVIVAALAGATRRRAATAGAVALAVVGFTYFDTEPYLRFQISRPPDFATDVLLVVVGVATAEMSRRTVTARRDEQSATARLRRVQEAASRVARGEELVALVDAVAGEISAVIPGVQTCSFTTDRLPDNAVPVSREGDHPTVGVDGADMFALPVWALGRVIGHYLVGPITALTSATPDQLLTTTALADQVGAAFGLHVALPPVPPGGTPPARSLHVVPNS